VSTRFGQSAHGCGNASKVKVRRHVGRVDPHRLLKPGRGIIDLIAGQEQAAKIGAQNPIARMLSRQAGSGLPRLDKRTRLQASGDLDQVCPLPPDLIRFRNLGELGQRFFDVARRHQAHGQH
jgi:hypothetical protein